MQPTQALPGGAFRATVELAGRTATGVRVPAAVVDALEAAPEVLHYFESLSYSRQRWFVLNVEDAKTPETRARRIERAIERLT